MKTYILCDMEGISGIRTMPQVQSNSPTYGEGRRLMMADLNAAVAGAFDGGAEEVVVCDTHAGGGQLELAGMDARAVYELPGGGRMMPSLSDEFAGVVLLGHHARAGTLNGFLDHTMNSKEIFEVRIGETAVGEIGLEAAFAGHYGVPVLMVSGDAAAGAEARELLGEVETAVVKWGIGRNRAKCLPPERAHERIREAAGAAVRRAGEEAFRPFRPGTPAEVTVTLYRSDMADAYAARPGVERLDARTVRRTAETLLDIWRW
jgi:D-amino peptidase